MKEKQSDFTVATRSTSVRRHVAMCFLPLVPFLLLGFGLLGGGYWLVLPTAFFMLVAPLLDLLTGWQDDARYERHEFPPAAIFLLHWNTRLYALLYLGTVFWLAASLQRFSGLETALLLSATGLLGGIGFAAAHELLHGTSRFDQVLQRLMTAVLFYPHYKQIHVQSHHLHAATGHDENTAWMNEDIYSYLLRTIPRSMLRVWRLEDERLAEKEGIASAFGRAVRNRMLTYAAGQVILLFVLYLLGGAAGLLFYLAHLVIAHLVLESVNYIQHYGVLRRRQGDRFEKTGAEHTWDTYHYFSSYVTFRVGHHSNHHLVVKPYYLLAPEPAAPKLPAGYFWTIPMVLLPPCWRRVANPVLASVRAS